MRLDYGDYAAQLVSERIHATVASLAILKATPPKLRVHGMIAVVQADGSMWRYHSTSVLTGDDVLISTPSDAPAAGRWLRVPGGMRLKLAIAFGTADAAILLTFQAGQLFRLIEPAWHVTTSFSGGAASAIGVSSSTKANLTTKGDILGGATGDVAASLTSALGVNAPGTVGAGYDTLAKRRINFAPTDTIRFDRITSAFTAGVGFVVLDGILAANDGA